MRSFAVALALVSVAQTPVPDRTLVVHDFDASAEGWVIAGDTGTAEPTFHPEGGHPGGYISGEDEALGETWYFSAPQTSLDRLSAAEGGRLSYSLKQSPAGDGYLDDDVVIVGAAGRLSYRFDHEPGADWTTFTVRLSAGDPWTWNWNARATDEQIRAVLRHPTRLELRGEFQTGPDAAGLDSVVISAAE